MTAVLKKIKRDVPLAPMTTIRIGGSAEFFFTATSADELIEAFEWASRQGHPVTVFGGGSNVLIADAGVRGLVVKCELRGQQVEGERFTFESGVLFASAAKIAADLGYSGLECGIGIPGTIGGAIVGNASNFLGSVSHRLVSVEIFNPVAKRRETLRKDACDFSYRHSRFKTSKEIILSATFSLEAQNPQRIRSEMNRILEYKSHTQKTPYPTSGCMFKNPQVLTEKDRALASECGIGDLIRFSDDMGCETLPFRQLLERAGLKGKRIGGLMISDVNANFMVNVGKATAADVRAMIAMIRKTFAEKFHLDAQLEIQMLGVDS